ncbi:hypothetical protein JCM8097_006520 [Rhodosporidiobolus ruineniae]
MLFPRLSSLFGLIGLASAALAAAPAHGNTDFALVRRASSATVNTVAAKLTSEITATIKKISGFSKAITASSKSVQTLLKTNSTDLHKAVSEAFVGLTIQIHKTLLPYLSIAAANSIFEGFFKRAVMGVTLEYMAVLGDVYFLGKHEEGTLGWWVSEAIWDSYENEEEEGSFLFDFVDTLNYLAD